MANNCSVLKTEYIYKRALWAVVAVAAFHHIHILFEHLNHISCIKVKLLSNFKTLKENFPPACTRHQAPTPFVKITQVFRFPARLRQRNGDAVAVCVDCGWLLNDLYWQKMWRIVWSHAICELLFANFASQVNWKFKLSMSQVGFLSLRDYEFTTVSLSMSLSRSMWVNQEMQNDWLVTCSCIKSPSSSWFGLDDLRKNVSQPLRQKRNLRGFWGKIGTEASLMWVLKPLKTVKLPIWWSWFLLDFFLSSLSPAQISYTTAPIGGADNV